MLAQGRHWRVALARSGEAVVLGLLKETLPDDLSELRDLRIEVPLARWNSVIKHVLSDRKLLGGLLLDFASQKELVAGAVGSDRLYGELQRVALEATAVLIGDERLALVPTEI